MSQKYYTYKLAIGYVLLPFISLALFIILGIIANMELHFITPNILDFGIISITQKLMLALTLFCLGFHIFYMVRNILKYNEFTIYLYKEKLQIEDDFIENILIKNVLGVTKESNFFFSLLGMCTLSIYHIRGRSEERKIIRFISSSSDLEKKLNKLLDAKNNII